MPNAPTENFIPSMKEAEWLKRPELRAVFAALEAAGHPARVVGGCVRNTLMGLAVTDVDIATPAQPEAVVGAVEAAGLKAIPTGLQHGTVTVVSGGVPYEVTTLRHDVETFGRHATVAFTDDWVADASRRDFTMNALYCDADGTVHDPLGGYPDVIARRVRFIGDADARIREDYLRVLRFFRFHAAYGAGDPDRPSLDACVRGIDGLRQLSAERIRAEFIKLLTAPGASDAVKRMADYGFLPPLLGTAPRPGIFEGMMIAEAEAGSRPDAMLRLSALTLAVEEDISRIANRLRLANAERQELLVVDERLRRRFADMDEKHARRMLYRTGIEGWRRQALALAALPGEDREKARRLYRLPEVWSVPDFPIKGADILALGIPAGPAVGEILAEVESWWVESDFCPPESVRDRLAALVKHHSPR